jgi:hypothetical protein|tara:strand:+ start:590 stop:1111 length:522 start_codon:yes stop_codon:yes gene_type:complete
MANTTFKGPVRAENGFIGVTKDSDTGAITENITFGNKGEVVTPVVLADGDITIVNTTHGGRVNIVPDGGQDNTYTLPAPEAGVAYRFVYGGLAADATDAIFITPGNANFYKGNITHLDTNADNVVVYPDGNSESSLQLNVPQAFEVTFLGLDSTNYQVFGNVTGATAPVFADQ